MKPPDHDELLHDLLAESPARGPSVEAVLRLVRAAQARRRHRRALAGGFAGLLILGMALWPGGRPTPPLAQQAAPVPRAEPFAVKRVTDQEFLELLAQQDQPVALMKLPNGERRLLMVVQSADPAAATP